MKRFYDTTLWIKRDVVSQDLVQRPSWKEILRKRAMFKITWNNIRLSTYFSIRYFDSSGYLPGGEFYKYRDLLNTTIANAHIRMEHHTYLNSTLIADRYRYVYRNIFLLPSYFIIISFIFDYLLPTILILILV